jgi:hypothetical protein
VQAGVTWGNLNEALAPLRLFLTADPGPGATVGGMMATGCSGTNALRYGTMRACVLSATVVLADGSVVRTGTRARKSSAGYDLTGLFTGQEGTLGVVTELHLRLHPLPEATGVAVCAFADVAAACRAVNRVLRAGGRVACLDTTPPPDNWLRPLILLHFRLIIPLLGWLVTGQAAAYAYLPSTTEKFLQPEALQQKFAQAGFRNVGYQRLMLGTIALHWAEK